jgi:hypothetical protein
MFTPLSAHSPRFPSGEAEINISGIVCSSSGWMVAAERMFNERRRVNIHHLMGDQSQLITWRKGIPYQRS